MGFSLTGLIIAATLFAPNLLMLVFPPKNVPAGLKDAGVFFTVLERIGQVGCVLLLCLSEGLNQLGFTVWLVLTAVCIAVYWGLWLRYAGRGQAFMLLFRPLGLIPVPMAVFPVLAFGFAAAAGRNFWLGIAVVLFAIGHLANSWHTYKIARDVEKKG